MGRLENLNDDPSYWEQRRLRAMEGAAPLGNSSITRGRLRVASEEGLLVEGSIYGAANSGTGQPAHIEWDGTANFTGDVRARVFRVVNPPFSAEFSQTGMTVAGDAYVISPDGSKTPTPYVSRLDGSGFSMELQGKTGSISPNYLTVPGLPARSSPAGLRMVVWDEATGTFYHAPVATSGGGGGGSPTYGDGDRFGWPFPREEATDTWGWRDDPPSFHYGIDWPRGYGAPIPAMGDGVVTTAGWDEIYGNYVIVDHGGGLSTGYGHGSSLAVTVGQSVTRGQIVSYVGDSGYSFGNHLHLNTMVSGERIDPDVWMANYRNSA